MSKTMRDLIERDTEYEINSVYNAARNDLQMYN